MNAAQGGQWWDSSPARLIAEAYHSGRRLGGLLDGLRKTHGQILATPLEEETKGLCAVADRSQPVQPHGERFGFMVSRIACILEPELVPRARS